jgi:RNA polymerase sigma factor (sigma-70 family)
MGTSHKRAQNLPHHGNTLHARPNEPIDTVRLFFEDLSQIPIINGRMEYLPLTRRVQRHLTLRQVLQQFPSNTLHVVMTTVRRAFEDLTAYAAEHGIQPLDGKQLAAEIETFLDDAKQPAPPAVNSCLSTNGYLGDRGHTQYIENIWRFIYLLSLIPPDMRSTFDPSENPKAVLAHFQKIYREGRAARLRLVEGTLRYVARVALIYVGRGIPYLDLVQEGYWGLWQATETFQEHLGTHFQSHAATWIHQRIGRFVSDYGSTIRIPAHANEKLNEIQKLHESFGDRYGRLPNECDLSDPLNRLIGSQDEDDVDEASENGLADKTNRKKAQRWMQYYHMARTPHISFESLQTPFTTGEEEEEPNLHSDRLSELLIADESFKWQDEPDISATRVAIDHIFSKHLNERQRTVLELRFGLNDGIQYTLEEIGLRFGLTRERIRQIEDSALRKLKHDMRHLKNYLQYCVHDSFATVENNTRMRLLRALDDRQLQVNTAQTSKEYERRIIKRMLDLYVKGGRKRFRSSSGIDRAKLLRPALVAIGKPAHFQVIYDKAREMAGHDLPFGRKEAYATLFYREGFRLLGNGIFGLEEWENTSTQEAGETVLHYCPAPLLPMNLYPTAFFESIMVGREVLKAEQLSLNTFWLYMVRWAQRSDLSIQSAQAAFDAWYAAGLINHVDFANNRTMKLLLSMPPDADLNTARVHCLNSLCVRVQKMPELLLVLDRVARPTLSRIQEMLFGSEQDGFDVPNRLVLLVALDAVRREDDEYVLTDLGRQMLVRHPPQELPDFYTSRDTVEEETLKQSDEWELLDVDI